MMFILKGTWNFKRHKQYWGKKVGGFTLPDYKIYYKATIIKKV